MKYNSNLFPSVPICTAVEYYAGKETIIGKFKMGHYTGFSRSKEDVERNIENLNEKIRKKVLIDPREIYNGIWELMIVRY